MDKYSVRVNVDTRRKKPVRNRLNLDLSTHQRQVSNKRARQDDDKWEHDLFDDYDKPPVSKRRVDKSDLRFKLQKIHHGLQSGRGQRDLREKLSGQPRTTTTNAQKSNRQVVKNVAAKPESRGDFNKPTKKKSSQQVDASVDSFLESLGLDKYATAFQVEEVDMDTLKHMTDDDLKAMLIPLGPRKKILLSLGSKSG